MCKRIIMIAMILIVAVNSISVCPAGSVSFDTFNLLAEDVLRHRSLNFDVFYRMTYEDGAFKLNCHRVTDQQTNSDPVLQIQNISMIGDRSWKIMAVSQRGSCVAVKQGTNLVTYYTFNTGSFVQNQNVSVSALGKNVQYSVNDNCSTIRAIVTSSTGSITTKIFNNGVESSSTTYPTGTIFSYDFVYAIDTASKFYVFSSSGVTPRTISNLKSTPQYIKWSSKLQAVITVTKDNNGYSVVLIDPKNNNNLYTKTFVKGVDYVGTLQYVIRSSFGSILLKDDNGLVTFIQFELKDSLLEGIEHSMDKESYNALFGAGSYASVNNDIIFAYINKKISYFQAYEGKLYYLGEMTEDIETASEQYRLKYSARQINIVLSLTAPTLLTYCNPLPPSTTTTTVVDASGTLSVSTIDVTSGQTIKCPDNCATCTSAEACTVCRVGYSLNEDTGKCVFCNGCLTCSPVDPQICYLCFPPQVLNRTASTCVLPQCTTSNCLQCDINGKCSKCMLNYGLINSQCQKCTMPGCRSCSSSVNTCDSNSCMLGYAYYFDAAANRGICQPCASGCTVCLQSDLSACSSCALGYVPQADADGVSRCVSCPTNCRQCSSPNSCARCETGYVPSADGSSCVLKCSANCFTCDQNDATKCLSCYAGSTLNTTSNKCDIDISCNQTSSCLFCGQGFVLSSGKCLECTYTDSNCLACLASSLSTCTECSNGFYLKDNQCVQCSGNCAACVSDVSCSRCNNGYFLVPASDALQTGTCQVCDPSCLTCADTSITCLTCANGFTKYGSKCISNNRVIFDIVIQANVNNFIEFMDDLINWIVTTINQGKIIGAQDITDRYVALMNTLRYGSSIVNVAASAQTPENANAIAKALNEAINSGPYVKGYLIISGSATAQTTQTIQTSPEAPASVASTSNIGVVLGIVIPLSVILVAVVGIVSYKVYQRRKEKKKSSSGLETDGQKYSQKQFSYSQENLDQKI